METMAQPQDTHNETRGTRSVEVPSGEQKDNPNQNGDRQSNGRWRAMLVGSMALAVLAAAVLVVTGSSIAKKKQKRTIPKNPTFALHQSMIQSQSKSRSLFEITLTLPPFFYLPPLGDDPTDDPNDNPDDTPNDTPNDDPNDNPFTGQEFDDDDFFVAPDPEEVLDVLIIGAGWSGLGAGEALANEEGVTFKILEAADYIGGRTKSNNTLIPGYPLEVGSSWSYPGTDVHDIIDSLELNYGETGNIWESTALYEDFQLRAQSGVQDQPPLVPEQDKEDLVSGLFSDYAKAAEGADDDVSYLQVMETFLNEQTQFLFSPLQDRQFLNSFLTWEVESEFAAPYSDLSISDTSYIFSDNTELRFMAIPGGGFQRAVREVAGPIRDNIQLNSRVWMVDYTDPDVASVTYERDGMTYVQKAKTVLVTVSVGVLQDPNSLMFNPRLPQEKLDAINDIGMGTLNKMVLYWEDTLPFWPLDKEWLQLATADDDNSGLWTTFFNPITQGNGGVAVLEAWVGGDNAYKAEEMTDIQNLIIVMKNLREMFGGVVQTPTKYLMSRWGSNEFTKGSYSYPKLNGNTDEARKTLGENVENIFFAGEATNGDWWATATGAYSSGKGVADDILKAL